MTVNEWMNTFTPEYLAGEKPLQSLVPDGGMVGIFRDIACIGDSLASGEFESTNWDLNYGYHDKFEYSWGQYMARMAGVNVRNFSRGGMTAIEYCESFGEAQGFWNPELACQAYVIALGVNDLFGMRMEPGSIEDVYQDWHKNKPSFAGYFGQLISRYKQIAPDAKFFLMTLPNDPMLSTAADGNERAEAQVKLMYDFAKFFDNTYVVDLRANGPVYDEEFHKNFFVGGHMNAAGYLLTAKLLVSYIDYLIRHNMQDFAQAGFIGTPFRYRPELKEKIDAKRRAEEDAKKAAEAK